MRFRASDQNGAYYIEAESGYDAKRYARIRYEPGAEVQLVKDDGFPVDVELKWVGNDFSAGGSPNCKRLQVREDGGEWRNLG